MVERARARSARPSPRRRAALVEGVAANLAGGTHHASAGRGGGYCVFNDAAVAARADAGRAARAAAGGAAAASSSSTSTSTRATAPPRSSPTIRACSRCRCTARRTSRSARRQRLDVALPDGCGDAAYLAALDAALAAVWREHAARPFGLAFYLAGADPHEGDRLGRLKLTAAGLLERDRRRVRGAARAPHSGRACRWPAATAATSRTRSRSRSRRIAERGRVLASDGKCAAMNDNNRAASNEARRPRPAAAAAARRLPPLRAARDPLDGQRRLRPRQQRRLLQLVRHRGQRLPDRGRRARHRSRRRDRLGGRDAAATISRRSRSRRPSRPACASRGSAVERALRDRHVRRRRGRDRGPRPLRPRLRRPRRRERPVALPTA